MNEQQLINTIELYSSYNTNKIKQIINKCKYKINFEILLQIIKRKDIRNFYNTIEINRDLHEFIGKKGSINIDIGVFNHVTNKLTKYDMFKLGTANKKINQTDINKLIYIIEQNIDIMVSENVLLIYKYDGMEKDRSGKKYNMYWI